MANYKDKPIEYDAIQHDGANLADMIALIGPKVKDIGGKPFVRNAGGVLKEVLDTQWVVKHKTSVFKIPNGKFIKRYELI